MFLTIWDIRFAIFKAPVFDNKRAAIFKVRDESNMNTHQMGEIGPNKNISNENDAVCLLLLLFLKVLRCVGNRASPPCFQRNKHAPDCQGRARTENEKMAAGGRQGVAVGAGKGERGEE